MESERKDRELGVGDYKILGLVIEYRPSLINVTSTRDIDFSCFLFEYKNPAATEIFHSITALPKFSQFSNEVSFLKSKDCVICC